MYRLPWFILLLICFALPSVAQDRVFSFYNAAKLHQFPDKAVYSFTQDADGFIWIAATNGLYRYDGTGFSHFKDEPDSLGRQASNMLMSIHFDADLNRIWLISLTAFKYFDLNSYQFIDLNVQGFEPPDSFDPMLKASQNLLWVGTNKFVYQYNLRTGKYQSMLGLLKNKPADFKQVVISMDQVQGGKFLITTPSHLIITDSDFQQVEYYAIPDAALLQAADYAAKQQRIWLTNGKKLWYFDVPSRQFTPVDNPAIAQAAQSNFFQLLCAWGDDMLWMGGSFVLEWPTGKLYGLPYTGTTFGNQLLYVSNYFIDQQGNLFRSSYESGFDIIPFQNTQVQHYTLQSPENFSLELFNSVFSQGEILFASNPLKGLAGIDINQGKSYISTAGFRPNATQTTAIVQMPDGRVYSFDKLGLAAYNVAQQRFTTIETPTVTALGNIYHAVGYKNDYIVSSDGKNIRIDDVRVGAKHQVRIIPAAGLHKEFASLTTAYIHPAMTDAAGQVWYVSSKGLYLQKSIDGPIEWLQLPRSNTGQALEKPSALLQDQQGRLWIGSQNAGLFCYHQAQKTLQQYSTANFGLKNNYIQSLSLYKDATLIIGSPGETVLLDINSLQVKGTLGKQEGFARDDQGYMIKVHDDRWLVKHNFGSIDLLDLQEYQSNTYSPRPCLTALHVLDSNYLRKPVCGDTSFTFYYQDNLLEFHFSSTNYINPNKTIFKYKLEGFHRDWQYSHEPIVTLARIPYGHYKLMVYAQNNNGVVSTEAMTIQIRYLPPFWKTWWFTLIVGLLSLAVLLLFYGFRIRQVKREEHLKLDYQKKLSALERKALRAQMNPHFIFNALNSIQKYILMNDDFSASIYLNKFAKLIRLILEHSNQDLHSIQGELDLIKLYVEIEQHRFEHKFNFELYLDPAIDEQWLIPSMLIQPHIENAIQHGLLPANTTGKLELRFSLISDKQIAISISDNGLGRKAAQEQKRKQLNINKSYGSQISQDRVVHINQQYKTTPYFAVIDLHDDTGMPSGTRVELHLPVLKANTIQQDESYNH